MMGANAKKRIKIRILRNKAAASIEENITNRHKQSILSPQINAIKIL